MRKRQLPSLLLSYGSLDIIHTQINVARFFFNVTVFQTIVIDLTHSKISMHRCLPSLGLIGLSYLQMELVAYI